MKKKFTIAVLMMVLINVKNASSQTNTFPHYGSVGIRTTSPWIINGTKIYYNDGNVGIGLKSPDYKLDIKGDININSGSVLRVNKQQVFKDDAPNQDLFIGDYADSALSGGYNNTAAGSQSLKNNTGGNYNTAVGANSLKANTTGSSNVAVGEKAMYLNTVSSYNVALGSGALYSNTGAAYNIAIGFQTLYHNQYNDNIGIGYKTLYNNSTGNYNIGIGSSALSANSAGFGNIAIGYQSLYSNTSNDNIALGRNSLYANTTGDNNIAIGLIAMNKNTTGRDNTVVGSGALYANTIGNYNCAFGHDALNYAAGGYSNTAIGESSLFYTTGSYNTANGFYSLYNNTSGVLNIAVGHDALQSNKTGNYLTGLGSETDVSADGFNNSSAVGYNAIITASNQVRVGNTSVTSIGGQVGWTSFSDGRYKQNIRQNVPGLAFINKLQPITYTLNVKAIELKLSGGKTTKQTAGNDPLPDFTGNDQMKASADEKSKIIYTGFVAQDVEKAAQAINYNFSGVDKPEDSQQSFYGLRYSDFVVPLVKAVQELSKLNDEKDAKINNLQKQIDDLKAMIVTSVNAQSSTYVTSASLAQNVPNPYNHTTSIAYNLPAQFSSAQIIVTDNSGKTIKQVNLSGSGKGAVNINAGSLASGVYQYSLLIDGKLIDTKKMILSK